jgi:thermitase
MRRIGIVLVLLAVLTPAAEATPPPAPTGAVVRVVPGVGPAQVAQMVAAAGGVIDRGLLVSRAYRVVPGIGLTPSDLVARLRAQPLVAFAELDGQVKMASVSEPNDPLFAQQWALENTGDNAPPPFGSFPPSDPVPGIDIHPFEAWGVTTGTPQTVLAVIDTGVDVTHPELRTHIWRNPGETGLDANGHDKSSNGIDDDGNGFVDDWRGWDFFDGTNTPYDGNGHGTHVAGIAAATRDNAAGIVGVASGVSVMPVQVLDASGFGFDSTVADGIVYAAHNGASVINVSLGGSPSRLIDAAVAEATPTALVVAAAGNEASDVDQQPETPCTSPGALCVAAVESDGSPAFYTNIGQHHVAIAAPGSQIISSLPGPPPQRADLYTSSLADLSDWTLAGGFEAASPGFGVSPGPGSYAPNLDATATLNAPVTATPDQHDCMADMKAVGQTEYQFDTLALETSVDGGSTWTPVGFPLSGLLSITPTQPYTWSFPVSLAQPTGIRLHFLSDDSKQTDGFTISSFSVDCAVGDPGYNGKDEYGFMSGTSMSTPFVAGAAALLKSAKPSLTVEQIRHAIVASARPLPEFDGLVSSGGMLDLTAAMRRVVPFSGPPPRATQAPLIFGRAQVGTPLFCDGAEFSGTVDTTRTEWLRAGRRIVTDAPVYTPTRRDLGHRLRCRVVATNPAGRATAASGQTRRVLPAAPSNRFPPRIFGSGLVGTSLRCWPGLWHGVTSFRFAWYVDGARQHHRRGARLPVTASLAGHVISCAVTGRNAGGKTTVRSGTFVTPPL